MHKLQQATLTCLTVQVHWHVGDQLRGVGMHHVRAGVVAFVRTGCCLRWADRKRAIQREPEAASTAQGDHRQGVRHMVYLYLYLCTRKEVASSSRVKTYLCKCGESYKLLVAI